MLKFKTFYLKLSLVLLLLIIFIFTYAASYSRTIFKNISQNFLRLHIVANSDSSEDQILKYHIRDSIIEYISPFFADVNTKDEAIEILLKHVPNFYDICNKVMEKSGCQYPINISVGNFYFPTKEYNKITLPEGFYDGLKIEIGSAQGQNWWCVMYPSLCIINANSFTYSDNSDALLQENLGYEEYSLITNCNNSKNIKLKFKIVELFENI